jgi:isopenicillin-N epimerase
MDSISKRRRNNYMGQNHPTNGIAWEQRARRYGFTVKKISVPASPHSIQELIEPFAKAITAHTKLIAFSHISNTSGIALPAKAICELARKKGILTLIDGAQSFGSKELNLPDIGCDFYTGSTHKWLMGPVENGILFVKQEHIGKIWPMVIGAGWKEERLTVDEKICMLGQRNDASVAAIPDIIEFHQAIGQATIEQRILQLTAYLRQQIQEKIPQATFVSPANPELSHAIVVLSIPGKQGPELYQKLYQNYGIACAPTGGLRISPHIYNALQDMDRIAQALTSLSA